MIDPITREEFLLAKALGENVPDIVPVIRKEMYLAKIAGADIQTPEAITREEMYLDAIANGTEVNIEPITRKEMFYAKALGLIENAPEPITRIEGLLNQITVGGGGGSYDKYSWEGVFASIDKGTYATDYAIGDTVPLDLGSEGLINMQIAAFDTDDLADGSGKAPITWIAKELLASKKYVIMDSTDWETSSLRVYLKDTIKPLIPEGVRNTIKEVTKTQTAYDTAGTKFTKTTTDDVWLPNAKELRVGYLKYPIYPEYAEIYGTQKSVVGQSDLEFWWTREPSSTNAWLCFNTSGSGNTNGVKNTSYGICLCFCT